MAEFEILDETVAAVPPVSAPSVAAAVPAAEAAAMYRCVQCGRMKAGDQVYEDGGRFICMECYGAAMSGAAGQASATGAPEAQPFVTADEAPAGDDGAGFRLLGEDDFMAAMDGESGALVPAAAGAATAVDAAPQAAAQAAVPVQAAAQSAGPGQYAPPAQQAPRVPEAAKAKEAAKPEPPKALGLLAKITCPHCWHGFKPEEMLWVSQHAELTGDPILGTDAASRFLPSRFNVEGLAIDGRGMACHVLACPRCHLTIPRDMLRTMAMMTSVIGVPASGKSYFIAAMTWVLRRLLPNSFGLRFADTDPSANIHLNQSEETLFLQNEPGRYVKLDKTQTEGAGLYDTIRMGQQMISLPRPVYFTLRPGEAHPNVKAAADLARIVCLYDNAGEHFQPGSDSVASPVTQHMARSKLLMFMFDPTQDPRFRMRCREISSDPQLLEDSLSRRQETVLTEAAVRIRKYLGAKPGQKFDRPLIVIVPKADVWAPLISLDLNDEPIVPHAIAHKKLAGVDLQKIEDVSHRVRKMLQEFCPEFVAAAEDFAQHLIYIPVSALGRGPVKIEGREGFYVPAGQITPHWVAVPLLYAMAKWSSGLIGSATGSPAHVLQAARKEAGK